MLKRHQVLLEDWQIDYLKFISKHYDVSLSESIRSLLCVSIIQIISEWYPNYKNAASLKRIVDCLKKALNGKINKAEFHELMGELYFEARKAMEFRLSKVQKKKK